MILKVKLYTFSVSAGKRLESLVFACSVFQKNKTKTPHSLFSTLQLFGHLLRNTVHNACYEPSTETSQTEWLQSTACSPVKQICSLLTLFGCGGVSFPVHTQVQRGGLYTFIKPDYHFPCAPPVPVWESAAGYTAVTAHSGKSWTDTTLLTNAPL